MSGSGPLAWRALVPVCMRRVAGCSCAACCAGCQTCTLTVCCCRTNKRMMHRKTDHSHLRQQPNSSWMQSEGRSLSVCVCFTVISAGRRPGLLQFCVVGQSIWCFDWAAHRQAHFKHGCTGGVWVLRYCVLPHREESTSEWSEAFCVLCIRHKAATRAVGLCLIAAHKRAQGCVVCVRVCAIVHATAAARARQAHTDGDAHTCLPAAVCTGSMCVACMYMCMRGDVFVCDPRVWQLHVPGLLLWGMAIPGCSKLCLMLCSPLAVRPWHMYMPPFSWP